MFGGKRTIRNGWILGPMLTVLASPVVGYADTCDMAKHDCPGGDIFPRGINFTFDETGKLSAQFPPRTGSTNRNVIAGQVKIMDGGVLEDLLQFTDDIRKPPQDFATRGFLFSDAAVAGEVEEAGAVDVDPSKAMFTNATRTFTMNENPKGPTIYQVIDSRRPAGKQVVATYTDRKSVV